VSVKDSGLIHIYCGEGKGKTTCCVGLTVRAAGSGLAVLFLQFLKDGKSGELNVLRGLHGVRVMDTVPVKKFSFQMTDEEKSAVQRDNSTLLRDAQEAVAGGDFDMLVLDEILGAIEAGLLQEKLLLDFLRSKPEDLEVVLTGRTATPELTDIADYVSQVDKIKHPYDRGVRARKGIEF
jgi:cob(I)alamin adenosyltransferase